MKEQLGASNGRTAISALSYMLLFFVLCFPGFSPFTLVALGFLVFAFWNSWQLLCGVYLTTWVSMVVPVLSLSIGTYWYGFVDRDDNSQADRDRLLNELLVLFLIIWAFLLLGLHQPLDGKLFSLFILQFYITLAANFTAYFAIVPFKPSGYRTFAFDGDHFAEALEWSATWGRPLIIMVATKYRPPCKRPRLELFEKEKDKETMERAEETLNRKVVFLYIDGEGSRSSQLAEQFGVRVYPTTLIAAVHPGANGHLNAVPYVVNEGPTTYQKLMSMVRVWLWKATDDTGSDKKDTRWQPPAVSAQ